MSLTPHAMSDRKSSLFTVNNKTVLKNDIAFWSKAITNCLELYGTTRTTSANELAAKSVICSSLAGIGLAMFVHFSNGVTTILDGESCPEDDPDMCAAADAAAKFVRLAMLHAESLESVAERSLN